MLRGSISGFGEVAAKAHLAGWRTRDNVNISVIHDPVAERRHEAIRLIKSVRVYDDLDLMLDGEALDFVDIASPPGHHAACVRASLDAGAHVLVEKPLCLSLAEFDELADQARAKSKVLMCVHNWKHAPAYALARKMIEAGEVGPVASITMHRLRTEPAGAGRAGGLWRTAKASGGGILIDHGWHVFYLMQWLLNGDAPATISARLDAGSEESEEVADLKLRFVSGATGSALLSWRSGERRTSGTVAGRNGTLEILSDSVIVNYPSGKSRAHDVSDIPDDSYHSTWFAGVAEEFERAIREGPESEPDRTNLAEARNALALIEAARLSSASGGEETLLQ